MHDAELGKVLKLAAAGGLSMKDLLKDPNAPKQRDIILNGRTEQIGENLYEALRALREIPEVRNGTRIWVDSLCIDQHNTVERSVEVKRMDEIYTHADRVISHLGEPTDHADEVLQTIEMIGYGTCDQDGADLLHNWFLEQSSSPFFHNFALFMSRNYWNRIWIMQEIALANENSILICGMKRYPMTDLLKFGKWHTQSTIAFAVPHRAHALRRPASSDSQTGVQPIMTIGNLVDGSARLKNIYESRQLLEVNKNRLECFNTLWFRTAAENHATDPRDLIYGMSALLPSQLVEKIHVDYTPSNTYQKVMIDFAMSHIKLFDTLHWILFRPWFGFPRHEQWPSWVPNLAIPYNSARFSFTIGNWRPYWGIAKTEQWARNEGTSLLCRGIRCDMIQHVTTPIFEEMPAEEAFWVSLPDKIEALTKAPTTPFKNLMDEAVPEVLNLKTSWFRKNVGTQARAHHSNVHGHGYHNWEGLQAALAACLERLNLSTPMQENAMFSIPINVIHESMLYHMLAPRKARGSAFTPSDQIGVEYLSNFLRHNEEFNFFGAKLADFFREPCDDKDTYSHLQDLPSFTRPGQMPPAPDRTSQLARMFTTKSGYLGVALCNLQTDDQICILNKCRMPVALRPSKHHADTYELLGGVYVHGFMQGEAVTNHLANGGVVEDIALC
jgi:hypothetical protein